MDGTASLHNNPLQPVPPQKIKRLLESSAMKYLLSQNISPFYNHCLSGTKRFYFREIHGSAGLTKIMYHFTLYMNYNKNSFRTFLGQSPEKKTFKGQFSK